MNEEQTLETLRSFLKVSTSDCGSCVEILSYLSRCGTLAALQKSCTDFMFVSENFVYKEIQIVRQIVRYVSQYSCNLSAVFQLYSEYHRARYFPHTAASTSESRDLKPR